jgi:thioredoxin reductase
VLEKGGEIACDAMFFNTGQHQRSDLPRLLGCVFDDDGRVRTTERQCTGVPGLFLAGDADGDVQFAIAAAAEGAAAASAINRELQDECVS